MSPYGGFGEHVTFEVHKWITPHNKHMNYTYDTNDEYIPLQKMLGNAFTFHNVIHEKSKHNMNITKKNWKKELGLNSIQRPSLIVCVVIIILISPLISWTLLSN